MHKTIKPQVTFWPHGLLFHVTKEMVLKIDLHKGLFCLIATCSLNSNCESKKIPQLFTSSLGSAGAGGLLFQRRLNMKYLQFGVCMCPKPHNYLVLAVLSFSLFLLHSLQTCIQDVGSITIHTAFKLLLCFTWHIKLSLQHSNVDRNTLL